MCELSSAPSRLSAIRLKSEISILRTLPRQRVSHIPTKLGAPCKPSFCLDGLNGALRDATAQRRTMIAAAGILPRDDALSPTNAERGSHSLGAFALVLPGAKGGI